MCWWPVIGNKLYSVLFYSILFDSVLFFLVLFCFDLCCSVPFCSLSFHSILIYSQCCAQGLELKISSQPQDFSQTSLILKTSLTLKNIPYAFKHQTHFFNTEGIDKTDMWQPSHWKASKSFAQIYWKSRHELACKVIGIFITQPTL